MRLSNIFLVLSFYVGFGTASTDAPTSVPSVSANPTGVPTNVPSISVQPTSIPTGIPTSSQPTSIPTGIPTSIPTSAPTQTICDINILLFDLFGDGWGNSNLFINIAGDVSNYTLACGHCDSIELDNVNCNVTIWMASPEGEEVVTPWENYWVVSVVGETFVGGYNSIVTIDDHDIVAENIFLYNESMHCEECIHPKPPPKSRGKHHSHHHHSDDHGRRLGKGKAPKRPPAFANSKLYDELGNGWFNAEGWNNVCDSSSCDPSDTNCTLTVPNIPNALIYPRYYILNENKTEIIHEGTICSSSRSFELCENVIPHNGDFVFRVAGIQPDGDAATWEFCNRTGGINEELQFQMVDGECIPSVQLTAEDYCDGVLSSIVLSGSLLLGGGVKADLFTDVDANVLESDLKLLMPATGVAIKSWTNTDDGCRVHFSANFVSDVNLLFYHANLDKFISTIQSDISESINNGVFRDQIIIGLDAIPNTQNDILRSCTEITLEGVVVYSVAYVSANNGNSPKSSPITIVTSPIEETSSKSSHSEGTIYTLTTTGAYAIVVIGIVTLAVVAVAVRVMSRKRTHEPLPTDSDDRLSP